MDDRSCKCDAPCPTAALFCWALGRGELGRLLAQLDDSSDLPGRVRVRAAASTASEVELHGVGQRVLRLNFEVGRSSSRWSAKVKAMAHLAALLGHLTRENAPSWVVFVSISRPSALQISRNQAIWNDRSCFFFSVLVTIKCAHKDADCLC